MLTLGEIKGVGEATIKKLKELDIRSVFELFSFLPSRYLDLDEPISVGDAAIGRQLYLFEGIVERVSSVSPRGKRSFHVTFSDALSNGRLHFKATFYNMPFLHDSFEVGARYRLLARLSGGPGVFEVVNPQVERIEKLSKLSAGVYTQYPLRGTMGQNAYKNIIYSALDMLKGSSYEGRAAKVNNDMSDCFEGLHRPKTYDQAMESLDKLAAIDLAIVLSIYKKLEEKSKKSRKVFYKIDKNRIVEFKNALPFELTPSQCAAMQDIFDSLSSNEAMSRVISGDVGSGKTAVAFFAMYLAAIGGRQAALMAPTEILASQHMRSFEPLAKKLGIRAALLTSSTPARERAAILDGLKNGDMDCVIGTQSLIGDGVKYKDLSIAVIDEQHKFGVNERKSLEDKGATDILSLTATPIPRSMALTFYEDIDISYIEKRKEAATNVKTTLINDAKEGVEKIVEACKRGKQAFIVCPAIVDAEGYDIASIESFMREFKSDFEGVSVACLHGKLSNEEKDSAMRDFALGKTRILVATTVVEVGVDTKASEILILDADRFGLATLHQLRGRVGRNGSPANCYLQSGSSSESALTRLSTLEKSNDGQYLAEVDFALRGAGDFIGTRQSGMSVTPIFGLQMNAGVLKAAKEYSQTTLKDLSINDLLALTRQGQERVKNFIEGLKKVTLNS